MSKQKITMKTILQDDLNTYDKTRLLDDENRSKSIGFITKEMNLVLAEEKQKKELEFREKQLKLDSKKYDLSKRQFEFERSFKRETLKNEKDKLSIELKLKEEELKSTKRKDIILIASTVGAGIASIITAVVGLYKAKKYVDLTKIVHQHDYEDYKLESSLSKEQRNNLLNK